MCTTICQQFSDRPVCSVFPAQACVSPWAGLSSSDRKSTILSGKCLGPGGQHKLPGACGLGRPAPPWSEHTHTHTHILNPLRPTQTRQASTIVQHALSLARFHSPALLCTPDSISLASLLSRSLAPGPCLSLHCFSFCSQIHVLAFSSEQRFVLFYTPPRV